MSVIYRRLWAAIAMIGVGCVIFAGRGFTQTAPHYSGLPADEFLKRWLILGPLPVTDNKAQSPDEATQKKAFETDFLAPCGGEDQVFSASPPPCSIGGQPYKWKLVASSGDVIDLQKEIGPKDYAVAYALAEVESPAPASLLVALGSDDAIGVWLNGKPVHRNWVMRSLTKDEDLVALHLQAGRNLLLLKIQNGTGDWSFAARALGAEGLERALWQAAKSGDLERIQVILNRGQGFRVNAKPRCGLTAWQIAKLFGRTDVSALLAEKGADTSLPIPEPEPIVDTMLSELTPGSTAGAAVLVSRDGHVLFEKGYGYASLEHHERVTPETKFRIGSITKQFTASAVLRLQEQGKLNVKDPLSKYFPDFPKGNEVTLHHLLTHTSGIHSYTDRPDFLESVASPVKADDLLKIIKSDPYDFAPGTKWAYCNSGYFLLGMIVEKVSGQSYADFLRAQFFEPLGMKDTGVHTHEAILEHEATGYSYEGQVLKKALNWDMSRAGGAGSIYSTVRDLQRWNEGIFDGKVLSDASLKSAWTPVNVSNPQMPSEEGYGYGWVVGKFRGLIEIQHGGGLQGFVSQLSRYPKQHFSVVVLANAAPPVPGLNPGELARDISQFYLGKEMEARPNPKVVTLSAETLDSFVGRYDYRGAVMTVTREGSRLFAQLTGQPKFEIFPKSENEFFWRVVDAQVTFVKDQKGRVIKALHHQGSTSFEAPRLEEQVAIQLPSEVLDTYVGKYDYGMGKFILTVSREGNQLFAQLTGQPRFEIYPKSETVFFWKVVAAQITFVKDAAGKVTKGIHEQAGQTKDVPRIE